MFIQCCDAIQHAHQRGIIHRDIKPSNILVAVQDGTPVPKVIDFGVAKALSQRLTEDSLHTALGVMIGTPAYMSPEQAELSGRNVDTRTDVYSLGVLLYELLVGTLPFENRVLHDAGWIELVRMIREVDPLRPSLRVATLGEETAHLAQRRGTQPRVWKRQLRGELDWITMRAMEKDCAQRYASASELRADVARYLNNEIVVARPRSGLYHLRKIVARNKVPAAFASTVLALLLGFGIWMSLLYRQANRNLERAVLAEQEASTEAETARRVSDFLVEMFKVSDPWDAASPAPLGDSLTARQMLDRGVERLATELNERPKIRARLMHTIGDVYRNIGLYESAQPLLKEALRIRQVSLGEESIETANTLRSLAELHYRRYEWKDCERLQRKALAIYRQLLGNENAWVVEGLNRLGRAVQAGRDDSDAAEEILREALAIAQKIHGKEHGNYILTVDNLGVVLALKGEHEEAEELLREAVELSRKSFAGRPQLVYRLTGLANFLVRTYKYAEAESLYREATAIFHSSLGDQHPEYKEVQYQLAGLLYLKGDFEDAEHHYREVAAWESSFRGEENTLFANTLHSLGVVLLAMGDYEEAETLNRKALYIREKALSEGSGRFPSNAPLNRAIALSLKNLGRVLLEKGELDSAEGPLRRALTILREQPGEEDRLVAQVLVNLGILESKKGQYPKAEATLRAALAIRRKHFGNEHPEVARSLIRLSQVLMTQANYGDAEPLLREAVSIRRNALPTTHWLIGEAESLLGECLSARTQYGEAEPLLVGSYKQIEDSLGKQHRTSREALKRIILHYGACGKREEASEWRAKLHMGSATVASDEATP